MNTDELDRIRPLPVSNPTATKAVRTKEQQKASMKYIMQYAKREWCLFSSGIVFLLLGSVGDFVVPLYVGLVINALADNRFDDVGPLCIQLFVIVAVSCFTLILV